MTMVSLQKALVSWLSFFVRWGEIVVMAPDAPRSGSASALTVTEPIHYQLVRKDVGLTVYKCSGTPVDCIKLALHTVLDRKPDLIVGGINHGDNSAVNVHYSGTMGVVIEGCLKGVPSIGFSLCCHDPNPDFDGRIALCDAGTGIGKTYAYLAAATVASAFPTGQIARPTSFPLPV